MLSTEYTAVSVLFIALGVRANIFTLSVSGRSYTYIEVQLLVTMAAAWRALEVGWDELPNGRIKGQKMPD